MREHESQVRMADGTTLPYRLVGHGAPMLLVHGATGDAASYWSPVQAGLAEMATVVSYTQRGFTGDPGSGPLEIPRLADDAGSMLQHLDLGSATVVGMSLGGMVAQQLAADRPDLVRDLVLVATAPRIGPRLRLMGRVLGGLAASGDAGLLFDANLLLTHSDAYLGANVERFAAARVRFIEQQWAWFGSGLSEPPEWDGVPADTIRVPTLLVFGDEDAEMPLSYGRELADRIPGARLTVLAGAGHKCVEEQPDAFIQTVQSFLEARSR